MGIVAIFFPRAYGKANRVIPRKHRTINPVAPHVSFLPRVEVAQAARRIAQRSVAWLTLRLSSSKYGNRADLRSSLPKAALSKHPQGHQDNNIFASGSAPGEANRLMGGSGTLDRDGRVGLPRFDGSLEDIATSSAFNSSGVRVTNWPRPYSYPLTISRLSISSPVPGSCGRSAIRVAARLWAASGLV